MRISFNEKPIHDTGILVLLQPSKTLGFLAGEIDEKLGGQLRKILEDASFSFKKQSIVQIPHPAGLAYSQLIIMGVAAEKKLSSQDLEALGAKIYTALGKSQDKQATIISTDIKDVAKDPETVTAFLASGALLKSWRFDPYFTKLEKTDRCQTKNLEFICDQSAAAKTKFKTLEAISEGVFLTRHVVSEPPNVIYPKTLAEKAKELEKLGVKVEIFDEKELKKMGLNALVGVGLGSEKETHLVVMRWEGDDKEAKPIAFVGKGVTFDTGGISIKPAGDMDEMKWDMAGAGAVLGLMRALAGRKAKVNAVGVMGLVENMPSGAAQRPGDVVKSLSGQTIEILNTDAEGRLVLADALWYTQERFKPTVMINLATLTGAIIVALGSDHAGLFSNNDELAQNLNDSGLATGEKLWRLPLTDAYDKDIDSVIADVKNIGSGRGAGSITAAQFLQRFVNKTAWAHLDIAGTAWNKKGAALSQAGATAFGVRLLNHLVATKFEK